MNGGKRERPNGHPKSRIEVVLTFKTMRTSQIRHALVIAIVVAWAWCAFAADLRITLPKRTKPTPVQQLNREGVAEIKKHHLEKAEKLFYHAYLIDPDDPFTLNNLGYISELQGKIERAERYYELVAQQKSETVIDQSTIPDLKGRELSAATSFVGNRELRVNRGNVEAMGLLQQGRTQEADDVLVRTLAIDPHSPFTLNNLGYTMEAEGNLDAALRYYTQAAALHSSESIVVALDPRWRGKPISEVAADNVRAVRKRMESEQSVEARVARLNLQGVFALNHNDPQEARNFFERAYKLDSYNAFAVNNMGYVSEMNGDQETADDFYLQARQSPGARQPVTVANHSEMQGMSLAEVAGDNSQNTEANLQVLQEARRRQGGPIELKHRDNTPITQPESPNPPSSQSPTTPNSTVQPNVPRPPEGRFPPAQNQVPRPPQ